MRKLLAVSVAALAAAGLVACSESPTESYVPQFELVPGYGTAHTNANVDAYASFVIGGGSAPLPISQWSGYGVNEEGKVHGTCQGSVWTNPANKKQTGALVHPHCLRGYAEYAATQVEEITLEKIAARHFFPTTGNTIEKLQLDNEDTRKIQYQENQERTQGAGILVGHGWKNGEKYGKFVIDLATIQTDRDSGLNLLDGRCYVGEEEETADRLADAANWRHCIAETNEDGELIVDPATGSFKGMISAAFYADLNAVHDPADEDNYVDPDQTVSGYLYWIVRD